MKFPLKLARLSLTFTRAALLLIAPVTALPKQIDSFEDNKHCIDSQQILLFGVLQLYLISCFIC